MGGVCVWVVVVVVVVVCVRGGGGDVCVCVCVCVWWGGVRGLTGSAEGKCASRAAICMRVRACSAHVDSHAYTCVCMHSCLRACGHLDMCVNVECMRKCAPAYVCECKMCVYVCTCVNVEACKRVHVYGHV